MSNHLETLTKALGYKFKDLDLLNLALKHRSTQGHNNERLEFLGDSVLNFIIAEKLFYKFSKAEEGALSRSRSNLVNEGTLAELARGFALGDYLYLGTGELKSGGAKRDSILADAMEAIVAAIYLDSDMRICTQFVLAWYGDRFDDLGTTKKKDPKTLLQEFLQSKKLLLPSYEVVKIKGRAHEQVFHVECKIEGIKGSVQGEGNNRRRAEQAAAKAFLAKFQDHDN